MSGGYRIRPAAARDLRRIGGWYRDEGGQALADRFTYAAQAAFGEIAAAPGLGPSAEARAMDLSEARRWRIDGFPHHRIFYTPERSGDVVILRILHTSQDWKRR